jgi:hypothetical protein
VLEGKATVTEAYDTMSLDDVLKLNQILDAIEHANPPPKPSKR